MCKYQTSYLSQTQTRIQKRFSRKVFIRTKLKTNYITMNTIIYDNILEKIASVTQYDGYRPT